MADVQMTAKTLVQELRQTTDDTNRVFMINRLADGEFTRFIRRRQFAFAMAILASVLGGLAVIVGLEIWDHFWGLPGVGGCEGDSCVSKDNMSMLDWATSLINTLFGASLALALGALYTPGKHD